MIRSDFILKHKMNLLILTFCAFLGLSTSLSLENNLRKLAHSNEVYFESSHKNENGEAIKHQETELIAADEKDYIFLSDSDGKVVIIDASTDEVVSSYNLPEISTSISAIVNDIFYNINPLNGTILSTNLENLLESPDNITWTLVGAFPKETTSIRSSSAVNNSLIYFVTRNKNLYSYNTATRDTFKVGTVDVAESYASLIVVENILYVHVRNYFYSFDGNSLSPLRNPQERSNSGLFQRGSGVCIVGGNSTDVISDPVYCYDLSSNFWSTPSSTNSTRWYPGVVTVGLKTYIFGGQAVGSTELWLDSVEVLNHGTNEWDFIQSPLTEGQQYIQALAFRF